MSTGSQQVNHNKTTIIIFSITYTDGRPAPVLCLARGNWGRSGTFARQDCTPLPPFWRGHHHLRVYI